MLKAGLSFPVECVTRPQLLQDELAERSVQLEKVKRAGRDLVSTDESPSLKAVDILCAAGEIPPPTPPPPSVLSPDDCL